MKRVPTDWLADWAEKAEAFRLAYYAHRASYLPLFRVKP